MRPSLLARLVRWLTSDSSMHVSASWLSQHERRAGMRGVDLPRWRLPKEREGRS